MRTTKQISPFQQLAEKIAKMTVNATGKRGHKSDGSSRLRRRVMILSFLILLFSFPLLKPPEYFLSLMFTLFMYVALTESWNILGGYAGYISLGHVAFFSVGAFTTAVFMNRFGASPFATAVVGGLLAAFLAALVGVFLLRIRGAYFVIATFLLAVVMHLIFMNWGLVGASSGLWYKLLPLSIETSRIIFYEVMLTLAIVVTMVARWIEKSKFGVGLIAIREDEDVAQSVGIHAPRLKLLAFILSAFLAGIVGGIYGYYMSYIDPDMTFNINMSLLILVMAFFGGCHTWTGPLLGASILSVANQFFVTFIGAEISRIIYGLLLMGVIIFMPDGVIEPLRRLRRFQEWIGG
jgi:branched-chain amino acid transport system permease protein